MKTVLIVDESTIFRKFVKSILEYYGFVVHTSRSGFDGLNQLRKHRPDLLILDDGLNRQSINSLLQKKNDDVKIQDIPVIFTSKEFSQERVVELCRSKIRRFIVKPLKIDQFLSIVSSFFSSGIDIDRTPCQLNLHINKNLFLVEIAGGLNSTKLTALPWKIRELMAVNEITSPKIMLLMSDLPITDGSEYILESLLESLINIPGNAQEVKILTGDRNIRQTVNSIDKFPGLDICESLIEAIDAFFGKKGLEKLTSNQDIVHEIYLSTDEAMNPKGQLDLKFKDEP